MNEHSMDNTFRAEGASTNRNVHRFAHKAMATIYEIYFAGVDRQYASQAALEAFMLLDRLEQDLSRFNENSDITRINVAPEENPVRVSQDTFRCLLECQQLYSDTNGAFDVTIGTLMNLWLTPEKTLRSPSPANVKKALELTGMDLLFLDEEFFTVAALRRQSIWIWVVSAKVMPWIGLPSCWKNGM